MHFKIILVIVFAAIAAAGLGYGLLKIKDRNLGGADAQGVVAEALRPPSVSPPSASPPPRTSMSPPANTDAPPLDAGALPSAAPVQPQGIHSAPKIVPPAVVMKLAGIPEGSTDLSPNSLSVMAIEDRQTYFEFLTKPTAEQRTLAVQYFSALAQVEATNRDAAMRLFGLTQVSAPPVLNADGSMPEPVSAVQFMRTVGELQAETAHLQEQLKKAAAARAALMKALTKEQTAKLKQYIDAKIY